MSPEQAKGRQVDKRADTWAFGVLLYEMLTGRQAFGGTDISETLAFVLTREVDWDSVPAETPPSVRRLLRRCLTRDRKNRLAEMSMVRVEIDEAGEVPEATPAAGITEPLAEPAFWQRPAAIAAMLLGALALGGLAVWSLMTPPPSTERLTRFGITLPEDVQFFSTGRHIVAAAPDGSFLVYTTTQGLRLRPVGQLESTLIPGTDGAREPFVSPDSDWIGFYADGQLKKVAVSGGAPIVLCNAVRVYGASWWEDDTILFGQGSAGILRVAGTGGTPEVVIEVADGELAHGPQMLPDGEWVLFTLRPATSTLWDSSQVVVQSLSTGAREVLIDGGRDARYLPTGHLVYGLSGVVFGVAFDADARAVVGGPVSLLEGVRSAGSGSSGAMQFSVARDGSLVYVPGATAAGGTARRLMWGSHRTRGAAPGRAGSLSGGESLTRRQTSRARHG